MTPSMQFRQPITVGCSENPMPVSFHSHHEYEIYYFQAGRCRYVIGDQIFDMAPGDLILMNGMVLHTPKADSSTLYKRTTVHFHPQYTAGLIAGGFSLPLLAPFENLNNTRLSLSSEEQAVIEPLLAKLCELADRLGDPLAHDRFLAAFVTLLTEIYGFTCRLDRKNGGEPNVKEQNVRRVISFLEENITRELTLDEIGAHLRLNKYYLSKTFKEVTGSTIFEYLYHRRINQAKVLFTLDPERAVTEVAYETGFKYPSHFTRHFKAFTGQSPDAYRKSLQSATERAAFGPPQ